MEPVKLSLSGFLSYREPSLLDFSGFDLACISGSNGAGKSSLLDAITWALFGQARKSDDSLINSACQKAEVTLDFQYENNLYRVIRAIQRGKTSTVDFFIYNPSHEKPQAAWKTLSERSVRETNALIVRTLHLDYDTFINASFFLQGKADLFAVRRPAERKKILGSILGLDIWEEYKTLAINLRKEKEQDVRSVDARLSEILSELSEEPARIQRLKELEDKLAILSTNRSLQEKALQEFKQAEASLNERLKIYQTRKQQLDADRKNRELTFAQLQDRQSELLSDETQLEHAQEIEAAYQNWQKTRESLSEMEVVAEKFRQFDTRRHLPLQRIAEERARLTEEIKHLEATLSAIEKDEQSLLDLMAQKKNVDDDIHKFQAQIVERQKLEDEIRNLEQQQADARAENPRLRTEMDELDERIKKLEKTEGAQCPLCAQPLSEKERGSLLKRLYAEGKDKGDRYRANRDLLNNFKNQLDELESSRGELRKADDDLRNAIRMADHFSSTINQIVARREEWNNAYAPKLQLLMTKLELEDFLPEDHRLLDQINVELKELGYDAVAHENLRKLELAGRCSETEYQALTSAKAAIQPLKREIKNLQAQLDRQDRDLAQKQADLTQEAAQLAADQSRLPNIMAEENELFNKREQENLMHKEVGAAQQKVAVLDTMRQRKTQMSKEREGLTFEIDQLKYLEKSFGKDGVPAMLIEQALPEIENQANQTLARLSGNSMSVHFSTQRDYKDTNREDKKETLDIIISDGSSARDYEMFSGGEAFRVNFAIRLALSRVLSQRAGARLRTLVIDEGFGNQDAQGRQRLIEAIRLVKEDFSKILIITHLDELKEAFPNQIEIEKSEKGSKVRVVLG